MPSCGRKSSTQCSRRLLHLQFVNKHLKNNKVKLLFVFLSISSAKTLLRGQTNGPGRWWVVCFVVEINWTPILGGLCCGVVFDNDADTAFVAEICALVLKRDLAMELTALRLEHGGRPPDHIVNLCAQELRKKCSIDIKTILRLDVSKAKSKSNLTLSQCLKTRFDIDESTLLARKTYAIHPPFIPRKEEHRTPPPSHIKLIKTQYSLASY